MDIVLDTNIFRNDLSFRSKDFEILLDYLKKTDSSIILPQVIFDELIGLYKRTLTKRVEEHNKTSRNLALALPHTVKENQSVEIDIDKEVINYKEYVNNKLNLSPRCILPYQNEFMTEIVSRSIERRKPSCGDGKGFRDTLIWLTILDYCSKSYGKQIIFISDNSKDFSTNEKIGLHPFLKQECVESSVNINYYSSIKEFVEQHSIKINFINDDWLSENIDFKSAEDLLRYELERSTYKVSNAIYRETRLDCEERYEVNNVILIELSDYFIYEKLDNKLIVYLTVYFSANVAFEIFESYEDDYFHTHRNVDLQVAAYLELTIENKEITEYNIDDIILS